MLVEAITKEVIDGVNRIIKIIKYTNGMRVKRVYSTEMVHVDSEIITETQSHEQQGATV